MSRKLTRKKPSITEEKNSPVKTCKLLVPELREKAIKKGFKKEDVAKLRKPELCKLLGVSYTPSTSKIVAKNPSKTIILNGRACSSRASKTDPNAYTKPELVEMAVKYLKLGKTDATKLTKGQICTALDSKKAKIGSPKSPSKISVSPTKPSKIVKLKKQIPESPSSISKNCIEKSKIPLRQHQIDLVKFLDTHRGVIAAFDTGTGKTLTAVTASQCYLRANPTARVIVVTPTSLTDNFAKELKAYGVSSSEIAKKYEIISTTKFVNNHVDRDPKGKYMLIVDEAHELRTKIANSTGKKARVIVRCAIKAKKVLLLTATTLYNEPNDILNLAAMVRGEEPLTKAAFERMSPLSKCEYFRDMIMFYDNPLSEDYPSVTEEWVRLKMTPEYYREYRAVENKKSSLFSHQNPWVFLTGMRQATNAIEPCQKCEWAVDMIKKTIAKGDKVLLYSAFITNGLAQVQKAVKKAGIKYVEITGKMKAKERSEVVNAYNEDKAKLLFITQAGGLGLDLKGTIVVIMLEESWNKPKQDQVKGRAIRYKSHSHLPKEKQHVHVYHLLISKPDNRDRMDTRDSADEILHEKVGEKEEQNKSFLSLLRSVSIGSKPGSCPPHTYKQPLAVIKKRGRPKKYDI